LTKQIPRGIGSFGGQDLDDLFAAVRLPNTQSGAYILKPEDCSTLLVMDDAGANSVTINSRSNGYIFEVGKQGHMICLQLGAGLTTLIAGSGVTINGKDGLISLGQYAWFGAYQVSTDRWVAYGGLTT
jgi:hypothetical protein